MMEKITVELGKNGFTVRQGDRYSDHMNFDETMGLLACLILKDNPGAIMNHYYSWMRTHEQWDNYYEGLNHICDGGIDEVN